MQTSRCRRFSHANGCTYLCNVCMYACMYVCMYVHLCVYYTYRHIYINTHTSLHVRCITKNICTRMCYGVCICTCIISCCSRMWTLFSEHDKHTASGSGGTTGRPASTVDGWFEAPSVAYGYHSACRPLKQLSCKASQRSGLESPAACNRLQTQPRGPRLLRSQARTHAHACTHPHKHT